MGVPPMSGGLSIFVPPYVPVEVAPPITKRTGAL